MPRLFAQPYDLSARGFFFEPLDEYRSRARGARNDHGQPIEEFEIQFIDGDPIDAELARAVALGQANLESYLSCVDNWADWQKVIVVIAVGACGYDFDPNAVPEDYEIDIYYTENLRNLAEEFVNDGLLGDFPDPMRPYFDYDAFARDLAVDFVETEIAGTQLVYRAG